MVWRSIPYALAGRRQRQLDPAVVGRDEGDRDPEIDRGGQHEAVVVVRVLADEVDPAGRVDDADARRIGGGPRLGREQLFDERVGHARSALTRCCR